MDQTGSLMIYDLVQRCCSNLMPFNLWFCAKTRQKSSQMVSGYRRKIGRIFGIVNAVPWTLGFIARDASRPLWPWLADCLRHHHHCGITFLSISETLSPASVLRNRSDCRNKRKYISPADRLIGSTAWSWNRPSWLNVVVRAEEICRVVFLLQRR